MVFIPILSLPLRNQKSKFFLGCSHKNQEWEIHQYLHYNFCPAEHIKIYSQTLNLRRICSERKDLKSHVKDLKWWFPRGDYPQRIVKEQMDRAFRLPLKHDTQQNKIESGIPLVVTYNPAFRNLSTTLQN